MVEVAEIFRQYGPAYREKYASELLPSHLAVMKAIEQCRSAALGGECLCQAENGSPALLVEMGTYAASALWDS